MVAKGSNSPPAWKAFLAAAPNPKSIQERETLVRPVILQIQAILDDNLTQSAGSQKLFTELAVGTLNTTVTGLDPENPKSYWQLLAINDVVGGSDRRLALALVEHNFLNSLWRLYQKVGKMSHRLSQAVVLVFCSVTLRAEGAAGSMETIAARPELGELLVAHLTFLAVTPDALLAPAGLGTAQRCLQTCWELTRAQTPKCRAFRELLQQLHMAGRALQIAATAVGAAGAADDAQAAIANITALEGQGGAAAAAQQQQEQEPRPAAIGGYEERLSLAAQACSFAANLAGLGSRGIELSAAGLAPQRAWLLKPDTLAALRPPLEGLVAGLEALRQRIEAERPDAEAGAGGQRQAEGETEQVAEDADLRTGRIPPRRLLSQAEGAVRNLLMLLGLPTIVMGTGEEDVVEACGFVIRHAFGLYTEGYVDVMRSLRAAVSDPPSAQGVVSPYPGDYGSFFRAFAGHLETVALALGVQLEDWGVRFTGEQAARDLPVMEVGAGVDARIAHSWLKDQIQQIINWGHAMMMIVRMADQAKMAAVQQQQQRQGPQQGQLAPAAGDAAAAGAGCCAACGAAHQAGGPPLLWCSRCRGVRYCSRACQVGHWPQHKGSCKAAAAASAAAAAGPAAATEAPVSAAAAPEGEQEGAVVGKGAAGAAGAATARSGDPVEGEGAAAAADGPGSAASFEVGGPVAAAEPVDGADDGAGTEGAGKQDVKMV
ncbi:hypothetical protein PLESTB_000173100 [Pleodorina starrii]|uniref:MYND-type domain-containing protein n=1 Tax=Pleodorina starrii TaxID=330485 RepID=A0A9W6BBD5_9CHLO|nr:hypothetical protein PLESTB_000173100 [Pleodorina starrii]GLC66191.1 hypothetical protein PLESTF_000394800 [Pleodorina starrii]